MPIYAYQCQHCGHELEAIQKISDAPLKDCPSCDRPELKKQLTAPSFRLSGTGWYETDFKKDKQRNLAGGEKETGQEAKSGDSKKDGGSADKAPADKAKSESSGGATS